MIKVVIEISHVFGNESVKAIRAIAIESETKSFCDAISSVPYLKKLTNKEINHLSLYLTDTINECIKNIYYPTQGVEYATPIASSLREQYKQYFD